MRKITSKITSKISLKRTIVEEVELGVWEGKDDSGGLHGECQMISVSLRGEVS